MHEQVGASSRLNSRTNPSSEDEQKFEQAFHEFYAEAWKSGIRAHHLKKWAPKVAETLSGGETKFIVLNGCYGGKGYNVDLQRKITEVQREVTQGALSFDPDDDHGHGVLIEAALRLGKEVDTKLRAEAGGATPDLVLSNGSQYVFADRRTRPKFKYGDATSSVDRTEAEEKKRLLSLGLDAGGGQYAKLYYEEIPLRSDWEVSEYDGIESLVML
ncbi:hypothetical protein RQP46_008828 [Phenoliferia psychrophenolica]